MLAGVQGAKEVDVWLAPPAVYLSQVAGLLNGSAVGLAAQNAAREQDGAFTGEVSADMLAEVGCHAVLVGHSERRSLYGESDAVVVEKFKRIQAARLVPRVAFQPRQPEGGLVHMDGPIPSPPTFVLTGGGRHRGGLPSQQLAVLLRR